MRLGYDSGGTGGGVNSLGRDDDVLKRWLAMMDQQQDATANPASGSGRSAPKPFSYDEMLASPQGMIAAAAPGVGEAVDLNEIRRGFRDRDLAQVSFGLAGLALPIVTGGAVRSGIASLLRKASPEELARFTTELGNVQRGNPERAMRMVQNTSGGGVLNPIVEHVGDLTHRMTEMSNLPPGMSGRQVELSNVKDKARKTLRWLNRPYGFEREHAENILNNTRARGVDESVFREELDKALSVYADEHALLPAYNEAHEMARDAAISVGRQDWDSARSLLRRLSDLADDPDAYHKATSSIWDSGEPTYHFTVAEALRRLGRR
jgi:hypothetical protein